MKYSAIKAPVAALSLALALGVGCDKDKASNNPDAGENMLGLSERGGGGSSSDDDNDDMFGDDDDDDELVADADIEIPAAKKLPKRSKAVEKCTRVGKGRKRKKECKMVDPKPGVSAAYGVAKLMGDFRWGMSTKQVFTLLSRDIEAEFKKRRETANDGTAQDASRRWRSEQLAALKSNHTHFTSASKHRWSVSLIQYEYEDDAEEEMFFIKTGKGGALRKFYFFKDGELWKIFYAYSTDMWSGKTYAQVVEDKFKKWFGISPDAKLKEDKKSGRALVTYNEWTALEGEVVRSFDMSGVHGVVVLSVVDGSAESRIGSRLPNMSEEEGVSSVLADVVGGTDVCYSTDGQISECSEKEAAAGIE